MDDEPDVRLVDAHPECVRRHDDRHFAAQELLLRQTPLRVIHAGVVAERIDAVRAQRRHDLVDVPPRRRIHETRAAAARQRDDASNLLRVAGDPRHLDEEVWTVESRDEHLRIVQAQRAHDVLADFGCCGGGERQHAFRSQMSARFDEAEIVGPEVVTP